MARPQEAQQSCAAELDQGAPWAHDRRLEPLVSSTTKHRRLESRLFASPVAVEERRVHPPSILHGAASRLFHPRPWRARRRRIRLGPRCAVGTVTIAKLGSDDVEYARVANLMEHKSNVSGRDDRLECLAARFGPQICCA